MTIKTEASVAKQTRQTSGLKQEVFVPIKLDTKKGRRAYISNPDNYYVLTPLSRLLAKAYVMEQRLREDKEHTFCEFCDLNNISHRYLYGLLQLNNLSPKLKAKIMNGYLPKHLSIEKIRNGKLPLLWSEQENLLFEEKYNKKSLNNR